MRIGPILVTVFVISTVIGRQQSRADNVEGIIRPQIDRGCEGEVQGPLKNYWANFGTWGPSCLAINQGDLLRSSVLYPDYIIDWRNINPQKMIDPKKKVWRTDISAEGHAHIKNYTINVLNLIDQMSSDFLKKRAAIEKDIRKKPLSAEELDYWQLFSEVVGFQESHFSQYQREDGQSDNEWRLRITVGDPLFVRDEKGNVVNDKSNNPVRQLDRQGRPIYQSKGMFQLLASINSPIAKNNFDLVQNIENGQEYLYSHWARILGYAPMDPKLAAAFVDCRDLIFTKRGVNYPNVLRAAYGMYNGGDEKICRFAESDAEYAKYRKENPTCKVDQTVFANDAEKRLCESRQKNGYFAYPWVNDVRIQQLIQSLYWEKALGISRQQRAKFREENPGWLSFDLDCARNNGRFCLREKDNSAKLNALLNNNLDGKLFTLNRDDSRIGQEGSFCAFDRTRQGFICTHDEKWAPCLRLGQKLPNAKTDVDHKELKAYFTLHTLPLEENDPLVNFVDDPNKLCGSGTNGIFVSGDYIRVLHKQFVRKAADNKSVGLATLDKDSVVQILDFDLNTKQGLERWYKVEVRDQQKGRVFDGYIYGGNDSTWGKHVEKFNGVPGLTVAVIPRQGDQIQFKNYATIRLENRAYTVEEVSIGGATHEISVAVVDNTANRVWVRVGQLHTNAGTVGASISSQIAFVSASPPVEVTK